MKKIIIFTILLFTALEINAKTFVTEYPPNYTYENHMQTPHNRKHHVKNRNYNIRNNDLAKYEKIIFNNVYSNDTELNRLSRLEEELFGTIHSGDLNSRYENIRRAINCRDNTSSGKISNFLNNFGNFLGGGYPTGITPDLYEFETTDFGLPQNYGRAIDSYYGNNWLNQRRYNHRYSTGNGMNIHILD
ncbi:hypothetical protein IJI31_03155 [bacterium]|nr:hypothetical protein [bacterium]